MEKYVVFTKSVENTLYQLTIPHSVMDEGDERVMDLLNIWVDMLDIPAKFKCSNKWITMDYPGFSLEIVNDSTNIKIKVVEYLKKYTISKVNDKGECVDTNSVSLTIDESYNI